MTKRALMIYSESVISKMHQQCKQLPLHCFALSLSSLSFGAASFSDSSKCCWPLLCCSQNAVAHWLNGSKNNRIYQCICVCVRVCLCLITLWVHACAVSIYLFCFVLWELLWFCFIALLFWLPFGLVLAWAFTALNAIRFLQQQFPPQSWLH